MNISPKVSVITICFNAENTIESVMLSILNQDYTDYEYIIKDGSSTDATNSIINSYKKKFEEKNISLIHIIEADKGIYDAMNIAVGYSSGTWLNFMNADDKFFNAKVLETVFENEQYEEYDILYGDALEWELGAYYVYDKGIQNVANKMPFNHQACFIRDTVMKRFPYDASLKIGADYDFVCKSHTSGCKFLELHTTICIISKEGVSSVDLVNKFIEATAIQRKYGLIDMSEEEYNRKLRKQKIKQIGMDYFPGWLKFIIRKVQRVTRKQNKKVKVDMN